MASFKDKKGRTWSLDLTFGDVRRVKKQTGIDLLHIDTGAMLANLAEDPLKLLEMIESIVEPEDIEGFESAIDGQVISEACDAFVESLIVFFRTCRPNASRAMGALWEKLKKIQQKAGEMTEEKLSGADLDELIDQEMEKASQEIDEQLQKLTSGDSRTS